MGDGRVCGQFHSFEIQQACAFQGTAWAGLYMFNSPSSSSEIQKACVGGVAGAGSWARSKTATWGVPRGLWQLAGFVSSDGRQTADRIVISARGSTEEGSARAVKGTCEKTTRARPARHRRPRWEHCCLIAQGGRESGGGESTGENGRVAGQRRASAARRRRANTRPQRAGGGGARPERRRWEEEGRGGGRGGRRLLEQPLGDLLQRDVSLLDVSQRDLRTRTTRPDGKPSDRTRRGRTDDVR